MLISWYIFSLISLFIISALTTCITSEIYLFCSLFFVSHSIFSIIISEGMSLLILMSILVSFFSMFLDISSILISCITTSKLTSCRHAFNNISLIQKSFFFNVFLLLFILIQNISSFNHLFIIFMFLHIDSVLSTSISLTNLTMFFIVVIMILFTSSFSLMKTFTSNFSQWFLTNNDILMLNTRWLLNDVIDFMLIFFTQLSICFLFFMNFFSSLLIIFFNLFSWYSSCTDWQSMQRHIDTSAFLSSLSNFSSFLRALTRCFYVRWAHKVLAAYVISSVYLLSWLNSSAR